MDECELLQEELRAARARLDMAKYIDSPDSYRRERDEAQAVIRRIEHELACLQRDDPYNPHGSGPVLVEKRED
ncbi:MAG: hypothetical protein VYD64_02390 [Pseudomonadota bacterium]|nr:hypothetical protein [Pseudomonadota bacterium]